jgi:hypothetical protein
MTDFHFEHAVQLALSVRPNFNEGRKVVDDREELSKEDSSIFDLLAGGLSCGLPNPQRVGVLPLPSSKASHIGNCDWLRSIGG